MPRAGQRLRIIVGGMVGQFPLGGVAWDYLHYVLGLLQLGHDVCYHEDTWAWPYDPIKRYPTDDPDYSVRFLQKFFEDYAPELRDRWHYVLLHDKHFGMSQAAFDEFAASADIFLNVSGACFVPDSLGGRCLKVFMDTDPGYNQIRLAERPAWSENIDRWCKAVRAHDRHLTYAENIHAEDCALPRLDYDWRPTRPVVTLEHWAALRDRQPPPDAPLTTVMTWDYFRGPLVHRGVKYRTKVPEFARFRNLCRLTPHPIELAVGGWKTPHDRLRHRGWKLADAGRETLTAESYQAFIARSLGEWSIAKNVYTATRSGWFSCRTACYLAAGRPAVVQDTAWSRYVPSGRGVIAFSNMQECLAGLEEVHAHLPLHRQAAFEIARDYLSPQAVLPPMIEAIYASSHESAPRPPGVGKAAAAQHKAPLRNQ